MSSTLSRLRMTRARPRREGRPRVAESRCSSMTSRRCTRRPPGSRGRRRMRGRQTHRADQHVAGLIGLTTAREFPGWAVDRALGAELDRAPPERAALDHRRDGRPQGNRRSGCRAEGRPARAGAGSRCSRRRLGAQGRRFVSRPAAGHCDRVGCRSGGSSQGGLGGPPGPGRGQSHRRPTRHSRRKNLSGADRAGRATAASTPPRISARH